MNGFLYEILYSLALNLGQDGVFILFLGLVVVSGIINLLLACLVTDYSLKKRLWYPCVCSFSVLFCSGVCLILGASAFVPLIIASVCALAIIPVFSVRTKTFRITEKQRDLIKFIDSKICESESQPETDFSVGNIRSDENLNNYAQKNERDKKSVSDFDLDFQHVKSVIARLDYFGLKECDKKQVKELESALYSAENGNFGQEIKSKINDGLGALLKIMSKYGV